MGSVFLLFIFGLMIIQRISESKAKHKFLVAYAGWHGALCFQLLLSPVKNRR